MVLGQQDIHMEKKICHLLHTSCKNQLQMEDSYKCNSENYEASRGYYRRIC